MEGLLGSVDSILQALRGKMACGVLKGSPVLEGSCRDGSKDRQGSENALPGGVYLTCEPAMRL